jgi:ATP-dependent Clp protease ATP-binding subunit ClpA
MVPKMSMLFSDSAESALVGALSLGKGLRHEYVGTVHLLVAALQVLEPNDDIGLGISAAAIKECLATIRTQSQKEFLAIPFTPRAATCLVNAIAEARQSNIRHVTPEFIIKYCLKESITPGIKSETANVFNRLGVKSSVINDAIARIDKSVWGGQGGNAAG